MAADGLREDAHRGLIEALTRVGRDAEALRAYEHCRRALREALGTEPSRETQALYDRLLRGPAAPAPVLSGRRAGHELPFMGRHDELRLLAHSVEVADGLSVAVITGEPGIGKTRLAREALGRSGPHRLLETKCFQLTASVPYALLDDLIASSEPVEPRSSPETRPTSDVPPAAQPALAAAMAERLLGDMPVTMFIDDLQWADRSSLVVLSMVLRRLEGHRLSVVATVRDRQITTDHPAQQFLELAGRLAPLERVALGPLTPDDVDAAGLGYAEWERSGGHPLFLTERARGASDGDLAALIAERAARAGFTGSEILSAAAVLDRRATIDELARVADLPTAESRRAAIRLKAEALLDGEAGTWRVRHDVLSALVLSSLDGRSRRRLHHRALAGLAGVPAAELAQHAIGAGEWPRAVELCLQAGEEALAAFADHEALAQFGTGLGIALDHCVGDPDQRRRLTLGAARAQLVQGNGREALEALRTLPPGTDAEEFDRLAWTARAAWVAWRPSQGLGPAQEALGVAQRLNAPSLMGEAHSLAANAYGSLGEFDRSFEHTREAVARFSEAGREPPALLWLRLAINQHHLGHEHDALETLGRLRHAAREQRDETSLVMECWERALILGGLGRHGEALRALDEVTRVGRGEEFYARAKIPNTRGWLLGELGLAAEALDANEEALEEARSRSQVGPEPTAQTLLNLVRDYLAVDDPDRAHTCLIEAEELADDTEVAWYRLRNRLEYLRGVYALETGDPDAAFDAAEATRRLADTFDAPRYRIRAGILSGRAHLATERTDDGVRALRAAARSAHQLGFAALAEEAHRLLARSTGSDHHRRQADRWWSRIVASVDEPLRSRVAARGD